MKKSDFWEDFEHGFARLDPRGQLRADGFYKIGSGGPGGRGETIYEWALKGELSFANRFRVLAHKAGAALGRTDLEPWVAWLQALEQNSYARMDLDRTHMGEGGIFWKPPIEGFLTVHIDKVCRASADLCAKFQLEALEAEALPNSARAIEPLPAKQPIADALQAQQQVPARTKRGRKSRFAPEQLQEALKMKEAKKTNNEIAKVLYRTRTPTPAQRRSVPTTLRYHFKPNK